MAVVHCFSDLLVPVFIKASVYVPSCLIKLLQIPNFSVFFLHGSSSCVCIPRTSHAGPCQRLSWKVFASVHNLKGITVAGFKLKVRRSSLTRWMKTNTWQIWSHSLVPSAFLSLSVSLSVCKWAPQTVSLQVCQVYEPHHPLMPPVFPCL